MKGLRAATSFLTRIPVRSDGDDLASAVKWFPIVGLGVGAAAGAVYWVLAGPLGRPFAAVVGVAVAVAVTGAFHEDGLADTFDGLSSIRSPERQIEIMRDSRLGTFGVAALVLVLTARVSLVAGLEPGLGVIGVLAWAHGVSRAATVGVMAWARTPPGVVGSGADHLAALRRGPALMIALAVASTGRFVVGDRILLGVVGACVGPVLVWAWAQRRIGGVTGDVLGACQQMGLVGALALASV